MPTTLSEEVIHSASAYHTATKGLYNATQSAVLLDPIGGSVHAENFQTNALLLMLAQLLWDKGLALDEEDAMDKACKALSGLALTPSFYAVYKEGKGMGL